MTKKINQTNLTKTNIKYTRKSTDEKDKQLLSLESQNLELDNLSKARGYKFDYDFSESKSAKMIGRPEFNKMIDFIQKSKNPCTITAWHANRLSRNNQDTTTLIQLIEEGKLVEIITPQMTFRNTPNDKFFFNFWCAQSKLENDNKSIDIARGMRMRALKGYYPGIAPLGYTENGASNADNLQKIPDKNFLLFKKALKLILNKTYTPAQMLDIINDEWQVKSKHGVKIGKASFYGAFLRNPFICGEYQWPKGQGEFIKGTHEPMITRREWEEIQRIIDNNNTNKIKPVEKVFPYGNGLIRCGECNSPIISYNREKHQKNGIVRTYIYNECKADKNCSQGCTESKILDAQVDEYLSAIEIPKELHDLAMSWVKRENQIKTLEFQALLDNYSKRKESLITSSSNLIDMRASGSISQEIFEEKKKKYEKETKELDEKINNLTQDGIAWIDLADKMFTFAEFSKRMYEKGDVNMKRQILRALCSNLTLKDKKLCISKDSWVYPLQELVSYIKNQKAYFEPINLKNSLQIKSNLKMDRYGTELCSQ
jgi:site-specific DNA recombinase